MPSAAAAMRRVVVDFPEYLLERADQAAAELATNRSGLIRTAVEEYLNAQRRRALETELAAAYEANNDTARRICEDFSAVDSENI